MSDMPDAAAQHLAAILESCEDAIISTDLANNVRSWNAGAERLFGYRAADAIDKSIGELVPPYSRAEEQLILSRVANGETISNLATVRRRRDGADVAVSITVAPIRTPDGKIVGTIRIARDAAARHGDERAARRLAAIVESSDDAIISKDLDGIVISWNRGAEQIFGYSAAEMVGESIRRIIPNDRHAEEANVLAQIRRGNKVDHFETIRQRKDGTLVPISLTVSPILDINGAIVGASKIARDISERRQAEVERTRLADAAAENASIMARLNEVGTVVASSLDRETILQAVTDAATQGTHAEFGAFFYNVVNESGESDTLYTLSGAPREAFARFPLPRNTAVFDATFHGHGVVRSDDITRDPRYGQSAPYHGLPPGHLPVRSYLAVPVKARTGDVLGGLFFGHSQPGRFTELHERLVAGIANWASVALENARLYDRVQEASRLKDEFLATLSHELRTPLNAILGYARMLRSGIVAPERATRAIETIERNATSLTQIVEDVLDVSRIIAGKLRIDVQAVEVPDVIRSAIDVVTPAADAKGIHLGVVLDPKASPVSGDPERLQQVVWNLLANAVKFTSRGGRVQARLERADSEAVIIVSDTGIGIPPEFLPFIFDRFRQADSGTTRERGGLGLGLGIARQLVELHGGTIQAASEGIGKGATFTVKLPLMIMRAEPADVPARSSRAGKSPMIAVPDLNGVRVLVVDDERDALGMVREILEATGADVTVADSAAAALEVLPIIRPDVLVADLGLPHMDGFELISRVRQSDDEAVRNVPATALTAYARSEDRVKALRAGFQMHLAKPIDPAELMAAIAALARRAPLA